MRSAIALALVLLAGSAVASELVPHKPMPAGVPETFTPGKPEAGGVRYSYPYVKDRYGRYGLMDWCHRFGQDCGKRCGELPSPVADQEPEVGLGRLLAPTGFFSRCTGVVHPAHV